MFYAFLQPCKWAPPALFWRYMGKSFSSLTFPCSPEEFSCYFIKIWRIEVEKTASPKYSLMQLGGWDCREVLMGRRAKLCSSTEGSHIDDNSTYGGTDGCSGVLVLKNGVSCPKRLGKVGFGARRCLGYVWKAGQSDMVAGWTLGSVSLGMPWSQLLDEET